MSRNLFAVVVATATLFTPVLATPARAQNQNKAAAEAAFRDGKRLMAAGKIADACAKFEQSQKLDPQFGTVYNLAVCYQQAGRFASAWSSFSELSQTDTNEARRADSSKRVRDIEPRLTKMVLRVAEPVPGLVVTQDGNDVTLLVGVESPVDAGTYQFEARAPGYRTWTQPVTMKGEGKTITVDIPVLDRDPGVELPPSSENPIKPRPISGGGNGKIVQGPPPSNTRKWIGLGVGGFGLVAVGVGTVFGLQASSLQGEAEDICGGNVKACKNDPAGDNLKKANAKIDSARTKATLSTVSIGVGVAAIAGGVILYLTAPSGERQRAVSVSPLIGGDQVGVALSGHF